MGLLGIARFGAVLPRPLAEVILAVEVFNAATRSADRLIGEMHRIGAHVGDETALIETLRTTHGFASREAELAVGLLLESAGGERGNRLANRGLLFHGIHRPGTGGDLFSQCTGLLLTQQAYVTARFETTGAFVEIAATGDATAVHVGEFRFEATSSQFKLRLEIPVAAAAERASGPFPLNQKSNGNRLHPASRQPPGHLFPQQR